MPQRPTSLTIRTYQVGFGDCFLLSFGYAQDDERHVLIDFGSTGLPKSAGKKHLLTVAQDIKLRTGGKLHAVVATHRHKDHVSGFATSKGTGPGDVIAALKPDVVVQPWTEDPAAARDARRATSKRGGNAVGPAPHGLAERTALHLSALGEMQNVAASAVAVTQRMRAALDYGLADQLRFIGDDNLPNRSAIDNLIAMGRGNRARYVNAGGPSGLEAVLPGVTVHVLGPPTLEQTDTIRTQRDRDAAEFWHFWRRQAAAGSGAVAAPGEHATPLFPRHVEKEIPPSVRWFRQRLTEVHADSLMQLVRVLDDAMNNTSVILLFEVGGRRLLFPGDAQLENWAYALRQPAVRKLLEGVDVYKVGHHGSLNATPRATLWPLFKKRSKQGSAARLTSLLSTMPGKHGDTDSGTEVPRRKLVAALKDETDFFTTESLDKGGRLFHDTVVELGAPSKKASGTKAKPAPKAKPARKPRPAKAAVTAGRAAGEADPLHRFARPPPRGATRRLRFEGGEHAWLGNAGAQLACLELRQAGLDVADAEFLAVKRLHGPLTLQYGELVALSGDFYESPSELFEERPSPVPWLWEANDLSDIRAMFKVELAWIEDRQRGRGPTAYPDQNVRLAWNAKSYLELALKNVAHFGWHNQVAYCRHHAAALELAASAKGKADERWARALVYNAFADHFLTDGFAAGHLRVPRAELIAWGAGKGLTDKLTGALSKLLHDQDGHVSTLHGNGDLTRSADDGLPVRNSKGARWRTFCDGQLFLFPGATSEPEVQHPVRAVAESVRELVTAWKKGVVPKGRFAATDEVPFPDPGAPALVDKFPARMPEARLKALHESIAWYAKVPWLGAGTTAAHLRLLFQALPGLLQTFRANVAADVQRDAALSLRLPAAYIEAYRNLR